MTTDLTIANEIRNQLGNRAIAMMGAKNFLGSSNSLQFDVGANAKKVTRAIITLDPSDTYTVKFYAGRGLKIREVKAVSDVYADSLHTVIESATGLYLSL